MDTSEKINKQYKNTHNRVSLKLVIPLLALFGTAFIGCTPQNKKGDRVENDEPLEDGYGFVVQLDQNWSKTTQELFYSTPQGSEIMPYDWILALEQVDDTVPFLDHKNIERLRYLPRKKSTSNPDGLPVGWTKGSGTDDKQWLGLNCAACHTTQIEFKMPDRDQNVGIRIDGAPAFADFWTMNVDLVNALRQTADSSAKFSRFVTKVLPNNPSQNEIDALKGELELQTVFLNTRNEINSVGVHPYGFGRIDAIGFIFNQVMSVLPNMPRNAKQSDAPASYPFLWGTDQSDVVQWTGFAANQHGAGTLIRNGGEVVGVYGKIELSKKKTYESSLKIKNLGKLENWVRKLNSPMWPTKYFPEIDKEKSNKGHILFNKMCAECHEIIPRNKAIKTAYKAVITPIAELGTDPTELDNMGRTYDAGIFEGKKAVAIAGDKIEKTTTGLDPLTNSVTGSLLHTPITTIKAFLLQHATASKKAGEIPDGYKARPLNGIWATAPYLHNGSIPNLYELLLPEDKRSKTFILGSRLYDPIKVGFSMDQPDQSNEYTPYLFDTSIKGNANTGHNYGTGDAITDEQRWQLVEYMKTL